MKIYLSCIYFLIHSFIQAQGFSDRIEPFISLNEPVYALRNYTIIDGTGKPPQANMTIIVREGIIEDVGPTAAIKIPPDAYIIEGEAQTIIPGFVMLHEHIFYTKSYDDEFNIVNMTNTFPRLYLAGGVTTMRTAGSVSPHTDLNIERFIREGRMVGPKMDVTGPFIERENDFGIPQLPVIPKGQNAGASVDYWSDQGCTSFKVYMHISKEDLVQVVTRAHARGMKVTGHLCSISYEEASMAGIDNLEHGFMTASDFLPAKANDYCDYFNMRTSLQSLEKDDPRMDMLMDLLISHNVTITTTPAVFAPQEGFELILGGGEQALHPDILREVTNYARQIRYRDSLTAGMFEKELYWIRKFYQKGGKLVVGTDPTGAGRVIAGYANLWTFEILVSAGFSIPEAVMLCSLKGAEYLERDHITGSITRGKAADMIIINGLLEKDAGQIRQIEMVVKDGIGYNSKALFASVKGQVGLY